MLMTLLGKKYDGQNREYDKLIYDEMYDTKLNMFLSNDTIGTFQKLSQNPEQYRANKFDIYKLFKRIILNIKDSNLWKFPLHYYLVNYNEQILEAIKYDIDTQKKESNNPLSNDFYESLMLFSNDYMAISYVNNAEGDKEEAMAMLKDKSNQINKNIENIKNVEGNVENIDKIIFGENETKVIFQLK